MLLVITLIVERGVVLIDDVGTGVSEETASDDAGCEATETVDSATGVSEVEATETIVDSVATEVEGSGVAEVVVSEIVDSTEVSIELVSIDSEDNGQYVV